MDKRTGIFAGDDPFQIARDWLADELSRNARLAVLGDFNIAPEARDVHDPQLWEGKVLFSEAERAALRQLTEDGLTDSIRLLIQLGHKVQAVRLREGERRYDIGNFESYFKAFIDFALTDEKYGYMVRQYLKRKAREF